MPLYELNITRRVIYHETIMVSAPTRKLVSQYAEAIEVEDLQNNMWVEPQVDGGTDEIEEVPPEKCLNYAKELENAVQISEDGDWEEYPEGVDACL